MSTNDVDIRMNMSPDATALEPHYGISELAERWKIGRETVRKLCTPPPISRVLNPRTGLGMPIVSRTS